MADDAPLLDVTFSGEHLSWSDAYVAVYAQLFYWSPDGTFFSGYALLTGLDPESSITSDKVGRAVTDNYLVFFVYLLLKPGIDPWKAEWKALKALSHLPTHGADVEARAMKKLEKVLEKSPLDYFIGPFISTNASKLLVPQALAAAKLSLDFIPDAVLDGRPVTAKSASVTLTFLNNANQAIEALQKIIHMPKLGVPQTYDFDAGTKHALVDIYRDDRNFFIEVEITYKMDPSQGVPPWITRPKQRISSLLPAIYLRPDFDLYTLTYDASRIGWKADDPVVLVLVSGNLHDTAVQPLEAHKENQAFTTVTFDASGPFEILRTATVTLGETPSLTWTAYYYFQSGRTATLTNPAGQPLTGTTFVLPPSPDSGQSADWAPFSVDAAKPTAMAAF